MIDRATDIFLRPAGDIEIGAGVEGKHTVFLTGSCRGKSPLLVP
jgi:hypothetical protein